MTLRLYNTLTRSIEAFVPLKPPAVTMYVCGPTVYDDPHIGHARSAYIFDVLRRYLQHQKYLVTFVRNVTDVDDKIIEKARQELGAGALKDKCQEVAERYLTSYRNALGQLGIAPPDIEPKATEHVVPDPKNVEATRKIDSSMTGCISQLITKNMAYPAGGDVYFSVRKFPGYGRLSNRSIDELQSGARIEPGEHKADPLDFALWKAAKPDEPSWSSPWGPGRPGWHIECSVMSTAYLGDAFDIHGGGVDLVFPHHENEVAQAQAVGKPFARVWVHNGLLTVNGGKMSKSLGNFITVEQALVDCHNQPDVLKVFFLGAHYRSPMDYTSASIEAAYRRWFRFKFIFEDARAQQEAWEKSWKSLFPELALPEDRDHAIGAIEGEFVMAMDNDLNTPQALACLDKLVNLANAWGDEKTATREQAVQCLSIIKISEKLREFGRLLGLFLKDEEEIRLDQRVKIQQREHARQRGDFAEADRIRQELLKENIQLIDTPHGSLWRRAT